MFAKISFSVVVLLMLFGMTLGIATADKPTPATTPSAKNTPPGQEKKQTGAQNGKRHSVFGTVTGKSTNSFTITTKWGDMTISLNDKTRFRIPKSAQATFADLDVGDRVSVNGTPTGDGINAKQIAIAPDKPAVQHRVGIVTEYVPQTKITIRDVKGATITFRLTAQTQIENPKTSGVVVGNRVTVIGKPDSGTNELTATAIVVHPQ
jgi:hypothetical protein